MFRFNSRQRLPIGNVLIFLKKIATFAVMFATLIQPLSPVLAKDTAVATAPATSSATVTSQDTKTTADNANEVTLAAPQKAPASDDSNAESADKSSASASVGKMSPLAQGMSSQMPPPESRTVLSGPGKVNTIIPNVNPASGALVYDYPLSVPPGRNGLQPDLKLSYNSQRADADSPFGLGWTSSIPYIERQNIDGVDKLYSENYFTSSLDGDLKIVSGSEWGAKVETGAFNKYVFSSNQWTMTDKDGTVYKFGYLSADQVVDPGNSAHTCRWYLEEIRDTNDNYVKYQYWKDGNQVYPSSIIYTGHGSTDGVFGVSFLREARTDATNYYKTGFSVTTAYRINEIDVRISGALEHKYAITFVSGNNSAESLIGNIVETGYDENSVATVLPATSFTYQNTVKNWTQDTGWVIPNISALYGPAFTKSSGPYDFGTRFADVNGDGLIDILHAYMPGGYPQEESVWINNGHGWTQDATWDIPTFDPTYGYGSAFIAQAGTYTYDQGIRIADVNGDGLPDFIQSYIEYNQALLKSVWINNGHGWTKDTSWTVPTLSTFSSGVISVYGDTTNYGVQIMDVNGDGLPDILQSFQNYNGVRAQSVWLNNGHGWTQDTGWVIPNISALYGPAFSNYYGPYDFGTRFADVNGDGLIDILHAYMPGGYPQEESVWINNGHGWTQDATWDIPTFDPTYGYGSAFITQAGTFTLDMGIRIADVNGDGLPDFIRSYREYTGVLMKSVWINNGHGWTKDTSWAVPTLGACSGGAFSIFSDPTDYGVQIMDVNGDGLPDILQSYQDYNNARTQSVWLSNGPRSNLIKRSDSPQGGHTDIVYKPTPQYRDGSNNLLNPNLPYAVDTALSVAHNDGTGNVATTNYSYAAGSYYFGNYNDRRFAGFNKVIATDAAGNTNTDYYHQGNVSDSTHGEYQDDGWKIGRVYRTETANSSGNLYAKTINKWDDYDMGNGRKFVKLSQTLDSVYDGDSTHKDKAESYVYDNTNGNQTEKVEYGDVAGNDDGTFTDNGTDKFTTDYSYASNAGAHILGLKSQETTIDQSSNKVKESRFYYDAQALGSVVKGNQTKEEDWKTGSTYVNTQKTYDGTYGLVATSTDARGKVTTYQPDSLNLYPASVTDPLSHVTSYLYDYSLGKPKQTTDQNNRVFQTVYDGLDRVLLEKQPDIASPATLVTKTAYVYTDTSGAVSVKKSDYLDDSTIADSYAYFDGLNRKIQTRQEAEGSNFSASDFVYDTRGLLQKESLPYFSTGSAKTAATSTTALYTTYAYDPMSRVTTATDANGTTTNTYNDRKLTVTDSNGKTKDLIKDAYGNLIEVDEHNGANTYVTTYAYDYLGDLTKITDALGNVRNFTYDALARRLTAEDLHAVGDATFGAWSYVYDDAGNLTSKTDPKNQITNFTYDDTNRPLTEDYTGQAGTEVTNGYDSGTDGIGRLTSTANGAVSKTLAYNALGLVASETSTINSTPYTTAYSYNRQGGQTTVTDPDSSQVKYIFNSAGLLDQVQRKESTDGSFANVVSNFDYSPMGQITITANANNTTTTNTYDAAHRYRLATKVTLSGATHLQDITYTYDPVGNVTQLVDASAASTGTSKTVAYTYDDLHRLLTATATNVASGQTPYTQTFTYNAIGDILTGPAGTYAYAGNQGSSYANPDAATTVGADTLTYDNNGNLLTKGTSLSNTWDYNNRLTQAVAGATTSIYAYDPAGSRVKSSDGTTTTYYPTGAYNIAGATPTKHITANGITLATVTGTGAAASIDYISTDHLTGANIATDASGVQQEALDYFPYGTIRIDQKAGTFSEQRKYAGHEFDAATGLSYMGARYYDGVAGRFLSEDPMFLDLSFDLSDPQVLNSYSYTKNNPIKYNDPTGRGPWDVVAGFVNAFVSNNAFSLGRLDSNNYMGSSRGDYSVGQTAGDVASMVTGAAEVIFGSAVAGAGSIGGLAFALPTGGATIVAGAAVDAGGIAVAGHGYSAAVWGAYNFSDRSGKSFTQKGKEDVKNANSTKNGGETKCENCGVKTVPAQQSQKGVTPPSNETHVDHIVPQSKGGEGSPSNGQVLCRDCNLKKSNH